MAKVKILAGDYKGQAGFMWSSFTMPWMPGDGFSLGKTYSTSDIEAVEVASEDSVKRLGGTVGWGVAGAALLGPVGLLAGMLLGGRGKEVTFVAKFKDGKKILATADSDTYKKILAAVF